MPGLVPGVDPEGLMEFSVVFTDRSLNHMSKKFQGVMRDIGTMLREVYSADAVALVPGGGTFAMESRALSVIGITSITPSSSTSATGHGNLHCFGCDVPSVASCDNDAAPFQYQILRASVSTTSSPSRDFTIPAKTPAEFVLTMQ